MMSALWIVVACVYLVSVRYIGVPLAMSAWRTWDCLDVTTWRAWLLFPVNTFFETTGEDSFADNYLAFPFLPIVSFHSVFTGQGLDSQKPLPGAKILYFCLIGPFWPLKILLCAVGLIVVGVLQFFCGLYYVCCVAGYVLMLLLAKFSGERYPGQSDSLEP